MESAGLEEGVCKSTQQMPLSSWGPIIYRVKWEHPSAGLLAGMGLQPASSVHSYSPLRLRNLPQEILQ